MTDVKCNAKMGENKRNVFQPSKQKHVNIHDTKVQILDPRKGKNQRQRELQSFRLSFH